MRTSKAAASLRIVVISGWTASRSMRPFIVLSPALCRRMFLMYRASGLVVVAYIRNIILDERPIPVAGLGPIGVGECGR